MKKLFIVLGLVLFCGQAFSSVCFVEDYECIAPLVLPGYDPDKGSLREWASSDGIVTAFQNKITARIRFDQESIDILKFNRNFGLEIEMVLSGTGADSVKLEEVISSFPRSSHPGIDTEIADFITNKKGTRVFALHLLDLKDLEKNVDYAVVFEFEKNLPDGLSVKPGLQITIDTAIDLLELVPGFDQFQYYALETENYWPFKVDQGEFVGVKWDSKSDSQVFTSASKYEIAKDLKYDPDEDPEGGIKVEGITNPGSEYEIPTTPNPHTQSTDIHIDYCEIRPYKEGSWHHEVDVNMAPGQTFFFELEGRVENQSNYDLRDVDIDYCFVKDKKDFDVQIRKCLDDDQVDIKEGEQEIKHSRRSRVVTAGDLSRITVSTDDGRSFNLPITQENLDQKEITLYFYLDVETEDGEDRDVSNEFKTDEYAKLEIHLNLPEPPPPALNLSIPYDQEYIRNAIKTFFVNESIEIPIQINKSGQDALVQYPEVALTLLGPEFQNPRNLISLSADIFKLNTNGEDRVIAKIDPINTPGDYFLEIEVDPQQLITETNEQDNFNLIQFIVKKRSSLAPIINLILQSK